uniref:Uncharacterized protein n=1 Tax=Arundo donax TaxID=35708 RepID=A0A0A8Y0E1_ARUDO
MYLILLVLFRCEKEGIIFLAFEYVVASACWVNISKFLVCTLVWTWNP